MKFSNNFTVKLFISITTIFSYAANLALCWGNFVEEWFVIVDAIIFGCSCTLFVVLSASGDSTISAGDSSGVTSAFISFFSIFLLVAYNYLSGVSSNDVERDTITFSVSSMGAADFVYNEDGVDDCEMKNFIIDHFVDGFRFRRLKIRHTHLKYF